MKKISTQNRRPPQDHYAALPHPPGQLLLLDAPPQGGGAVPAAGSLPLGGRPDVTFAQVGEEGRRSDPVAAGATVGVARAASLVRA